MPRVEISEQAYRKYNNSPEMAEFVRDKMSIQDYMSGYYNERLEECGGKFYACWDSYNYRID
ncbi:MAG: hypothetical protein Q4D26_10545 [Clostridia bacterium]|nr:hypothetical protein [Clostridia bacterium]